MSRQPYFLALVLGPILLISACSQSENASEHRNGTSGGGEVVETPADRNTFSGRVTETMDAGGYTYVRLEHQGASLWAAGPKSQVAVGEELGISLDMKMDDFHSEELDRTFEVVYFVNGFQRGGSSELGELTDARGNAHASAPKTELDLGEISKPDGGHTAAELWRARSELAGTSVVFRGRVVKYTAGIMGRNWLHVQDGSGNPAAGENDITITTQDEASVGDLVLVRGTVAVDKDFGAGYQYGLIVEDARVQRE